MGIAFSKLITGTEIEISSLKGQKLAVDSFNMLYQFLTTIRSRDGSVLMDSEGKVTSHIVGLFSRTVKLMQYGLKPLFVFDGKPPTLKQAERERRAKLKAEAKEQYKKAASMGDLESMRKYASRSTKLSSEMVEEAKKLVNALGLPIITAPSEGEAQAAHLVRKGDAYAAVSQDYDSLIHGASFLVRNLSIVGKRKKANKLKYETIMPEKISLSENLNRLGFDQDQLIVLALLIGTDYNVGGVKGIGPKKAYDLVKKHKKNFDGVFEEAGWDFDFPWTDPYYTIKKMPVTDKYRLAWGEIEEERLLRLLVDKHDFAEERVKNSLKKLHNARDTNKQKGLKDFL